MRRSVLFPLVTIAALAGAACGSEGGDRGVATGKASSPVINGVWDNPPKYESTVFLYTLLNATTGEGAACTGTLIGQRVVITARHCVSNYDERTGVFGSDYPAKDMMVFTGNELKFSVFGGPKPDSHVSKIVHPPGTRIENNDFAMLVLVEPIKKVPISQIRLAGPPVKNTKVAVAGYGKTSDTAEPDNKRYRRENITLLAVGPVPTYGLGDKEIMLGESICKGDSGGPVYAQTTSALLAVTSRGGRSCVGSGAYNIFARVDGYTSMIKATLAEVGETAWEEGGPKPEPPPDTTPPPPTPGALGATCGSPAECTSKICIDYDSKKFCSQTCGTEKLCPAGFECMSNYCVPATPPGTDPPPDPPSNPDPPPEENPGTNTAEATTTDTGKKCSVGHVGENGIDAFALCALGAAIAGIVVRRRRD